MMKRMTNLSPIERFELGVFPEPLSGCWLWDGAVQYRRGQTAYGQFWMNGKDMLAHRAAWLLYRGAIPINSQVLHHCDVPCCVNPEHLFLGKAKDNTHDMMQKNRQFAKLTKPQVIAIVEDHRPQRIIARDYSVSQRTICRIKRKLSYKRFYTVL